ncbi:MAG: energy transducer TonB [Gammaproteobacteria bacterium]
MLFTGPAAGNALNDDNAVTASPPAVDSGDGIESARSDEEIRRSIERYRRRVDQLQAEHGAYHAQLSEALLSLGLSLSALDNHTEAADSFRTALHISRINHGLHSMEQLPYLELLIQENSIVNNLEELHKNYQYLYWLHKRNYGDNDPRLLPVISRAARWHLDNYRTTPAISPYTQLRNAEDLYNKAIDIIETHYGEQDPRLIDPLYELALSHYYTAVMADREEEFKIESEFRVSTRADYYEEDSAIDRILESYYKGKQALDRIVEIHEAHGEESEADAELSPRSHAVALTYLGDWNMLFDRPRSAVDKYSQAYALLEGNGAGNETLQNIFGNPQRLPTIALPDQRQAQPEESRERDDLPYAIVAFDVLSNGRVRNIRVIEAKPEDNVRVVRTARRLVAGTKFRPRFEDGKPVTTTDVNMKYIINE